MKARDNLKKVTVRMALAAIKNAEIQKGGALDEPTMLALVQKEIKNRHDTIEDAKRASRADLIADGEAEIAVLQAFLPQQLAQDELEALVNAAIAETGAASPRDMGNVMRVLMPQVKGRADGKVVSNLVRQRLLNQPG